MIIYDCFNVVIFILFNLLLSHLNVSFQKVCNNKKKAFIMQIYILIFIPPFFTRKSKKILKIEKFS